MQAQPWIEQFRNEFGTRESVSGNGSTYENTKEIRRNLPRIFKKYGISSMLDIPCGDWNWMRHTCLSGVVYTGADVVPDLIVRNKQNFGHNFILLDAINQPIMKYDLILCRDFLFHLTNEEICKVLKNFKNSGSKYLLSTTFPYVHENADIPRNKTIGWRKINLRLEPFNLPVPVQVIYENDSEACQRRSLELYDLGAYIC